MWKKIILVLLLAQLSLQMDNEYTLIQEFPDTLTNEWFQNNSWNSQFYSEAQDFTGNCGDIAMLGGPVHYKNEPYYRLKMDDLPGHTKLKVKFKVWLIDGEYERINFSLKNVGFTEQGYILVKYIYKFYLKSDTPKQYLCGESQYPEYMQEVEVEYPHISKSVILDFSGYQIRGNPIRNYWGVQDFEFSYLCEKNQIGNLCLDNTEYQICKKQAIQLELSSYQNLITYVIKKEMMRYGEYYKIILRFGKEFIDYYYSQDCFEQKILVHGVEIDQKNVIKQNEQDDGEIYFYIKHSWLEDRYNCQVYDEEEEKIWVCNNDFQVLWGGIVQASFPFKVQIQQEKETQVKEIQITNSYQQESCCNENIGSFIEFCTDISCKEIIQDKKECVIGQDLFIQHRIDPFFGKQKMVGLHLSIGSQVPEIIEQKNSEESYVVYHVKGEVTGTDLEVEIVSRVGNSQEGAKRYYTGDGEYVVHKNLVITKRSIRIYSLKEIEEKEEEEQTEFDGEIENNNQNNQESDGEESMIIDGEITEKSEMSQQDGENAVKPEEEEQMNENDGEMNTYSEIEMYEKDGEDMEQSVITPADDGEEMSYTDNNNMSDKDGEMIGKTETMLEDGETMEKTDQEMNETDGEMIEETEIISQDGEVMQITEQEEMSEMNQESNQDGEDMNNYEQGMSENDGESLMETKSEMMEETMSDGENTEENFVDISKSDGEITSESYQDGENYEMPEQQSYEDGEAMIQTEKEMIESEMEETDGEMNSNMSKNDGESMNITDQEMTYNDGENTQIGTENIEASSQEYEEGDGEIIENTNVQSTDGEKEYMIISEETEITENMQKMDGEEEQEYDGENIEKEDNNTENMVESQQTEESEQQPIDDGESVKQEMEEEIQDGEEILSETEQNMESAQDDGENSYEKSEEMTETQKILEDGETSQETEYMNEKEKESEQDGETYQEIEEMSEKEQQQQQDGETIQETEEMSENQQEQKDGETFQKTEEISEKEKELEQDGETSKENVDMSEEEQEQDGETGQKEQEKQEKVNTGIIKETNDDDDNNNNDQNNNDDNDKGIDNLTVEKKKRYPKKRISNFGDNLETDESTGKEVLYYCVLVIGGFLILGALIFLIYQVLKINKNRGENGESSYRQKSPSSSQILPIRREDGSDDSRANINNNNQNQDASIQV